MSRNELTFCGHSHCWVQDNRGEGYNRGAGSQVAFDFVEDCGGNGEEAIGAMNAGKSVTIGSFGAAEVVIKRSQGCLGRCRQAPVAALVTGSLLRRTVVIDTASVLVEGLGEG